MIHGQLFSTFITPILFIMLIAVIVAFVIKLREPDRNDKERMETLNSK